MGVSLYPHQKKAIRQLRSGSVLVGGVGSGKSRTALAYYYVKECRGEIRDGRVTPMIYPKPLYIITTARKRDTLEWEDEIRPFLLNTDSKNCSTKVVIDSWNNIEKYTDVSNAFFIFDEQRVVGYGSWAKNFIKICRKNRWILLSATPGDVWMDYLPIFIANGFYRNKTDFVKQHVIYNRFSKYPKIDRYVDTSRLEQYRDRILVNMPCERKTIRHRHDVFIDYDKEAYDVVYIKRWNAREERPIKNASEWCLELRRVVNSEQSRIDAVLDIVRQQSKAIIFYNFDYELELLRNALTSAGYVYSEWNGYKHEPLPTSEQWVYLVQYTAGAEGWNCTVTDTIIFYSLNYSYKMMEQASGRIDRLNTPYTDLHYYYIMSRTTIDRAISRSLKKKQNFNERIFSGSQ